MCSPLTSLWKRWPSTLNIFWLIGTGVCIWFLFVYAPVFLREEKNSYDVLLILHLVGAYSVYLACVSNTLLTPSIIGATWHTNVGRFGLIMGVMGFVCGFIQTWWRIGMNNPGFSIGISVGGVAQMYNEIFGYLAIRKFKRLRAEIILLEVDEQKTAASNENTSDRDFDTTLLYKLQNEQDVALMKHVGHMVSLFILACGIPGMIRMAQATNNFGLAVGLLITGATLVSMGYAKFVFYRKIRAKREEERKTVDNYDGSIERREEGQAETSQDYEL